MASEDIGLADPRDLTMALDAANTYERLGSPEGELTLAQCPNQLMKDLGYGKAYRYAHDEADGFATGEQYLPDGMKDALLYELVEPGLDSKFAAKLRELRALNCSLKL